MKKANNANPKDYDDGMLPEYDFTGKRGVRGKYYRNLQKGYSVRVHHEDGTVTVKHYGPTITLDADLAAYFPTSESVNNALRSLIKPLVKKQVGEKKSKYAVRKKISKSPAARK